jgi:hypothetical protein
LESHGIDFKQNSVTLRPDEPQKISFQVREPVSGLAEFTVIPKKAQAWGGPYYVDVDAGFDARLIWQDIDPKRPLHRHPGSFSMGLVDDQGHPVKLEVPITVILTTIKGKIRQRDSEPWYGDNPPYSFEVKPMQPPPPFIHIMPNPVGLWSDNGEIKARILINYTQQHLGDIQSQDIFDDEMQFTIEPLWWYELSLTILGAVLYGLVWLFKEASSQKSFPPPRVIVPTLSLSALLGVAAYIMAKAGRAGNLGWLGIQLDTSMPQGSALLGFLISYLGIDRLLNMFLPRSR